MDDTMYDSELWAQLARAAGFEPINTESSARAAFRYCAKQHELYAQEINRLRVKITELEQRDLEW